MDDPLIEYRLAELNGRLQGLKYPAAAQAVRRFGVRRQSVAATALWLELRLGRA